MHNALGHTLPVSLLAHSGLRRHLWSVSGHNISGLLVMGLLCCFLGPFPTLGQTPGTKLWEVATPGEIATSPAVAGDGTVYVTCRDSRNYTSLCAFSPGGTTNWIKGLGSSDVSSPAVGLDGSIYIGVGGDLLAKDPAGELKWCIITYGRSMSAPAIGADGTLYVTAVNTSGALIFLYSLHPDGSTNWVRVLDTVYYGAPLSFHSPSPTLGPDGTIYAIGRSRNLFAFSPDGSTNWAVNLGSQIYASPAIGSDGTIYIGADNGIFRAIDPSGRTKWTYSTGAFIEGSAVLGSDGTVYIGSGDGNLYAFDTNGTKRWATSTGPISGSPAMAADEIICVGSYINNTLYALNGAGSNLWTFTANDRIFVSPVLAQSGTIYVGSRFTLYAISGVNATRMSPWPMYRRDAAHQGRAVQRAIGKPTVGPDGSFAMVFNTEIGRAYKVEYSEDLLNWSELTNFVSTALGTPFTDLTSTGFVQRYYRLATPQN